MSAMLADASDVTTADAMAANASLASATDASAADATCADANAQLSRHKLLVLAYEPTNSEAY